jgi:cyclomaltodextrinase
LRREAVVHHPGGAWAWPQDRTRLRVRLRAGKGDVAACRVGYADRYARFETEAVWTDAEKTGSDELFDYFEATLECPTKRVQYVFQIEDVQGETICFGERGFGRNACESGVFQYAYIHESEVFSPPEWARDAVIYQIFPDRFANGDPDNDPPGTEDWTADARPRPDSFYGGDLQGVIDRLPYLQELGVTAIYFTPLFLSPSNHKYDTEDYRKIDPQFGDRELFRDLVEKAHQRGIRVILDAVFNHSGDRFFAFRDVLEHGERSRYKDWFFIERFPVLQKPEVSYETFAVQVKTMPKLRTEHPEVKKYLLDVVRFWMKTGIDGWRLDVANEVDHAFWREFRQVVKSIRPDALIVGEIWHDASDWLRGDQFDSVMNYPFRDSVLRFFAKGEIDALGFDAELTRTRMRYSEPAANVLWNLIDSHDTERFLDSCGGDERKLRLAVLFQMTWLGTPLIYYGDEVGMSGGPDPDCRRPMIWEPDRQNRELLSFYRRVISLRNRLEPLRRGSVRTWHVEKETGVYAFIRRSGKGAAGVVLNNGDLPRTVSLKAENGFLPVVEDLISARKHRVESGRIRIKLAPYQGAVLRLEQKD